MLILFAIAGYLALLIQTAAPLWFPFHALIPNLIIILTVDLGLRHHGALPALLAFAYRIRHRCDVRHDHRHERFPDDGRVPADL